MDFHNCTLPVSLKNVKQSLTLDIRYEILQLWKALPIRAAPACEALAPGPAFVPSAVPLGTVHCALLGTKFPSNNNLLRALFPVFPLFPAKKGT